jgi:hypothetical protein
VQDGRGPTPRRSIGDEQDEGDGAPNVHLDPALSLQAALDAVGEWHAEGREVPELTHPPADHPGA